MPLTVVQKPWLSSRNPRARISLHKRALFPCEYQRSPHGLLNLCEFPLGLHDSRHAVAILTQQ
jgi:hypothetical protein